MFSTELTDLVILGPRHVLVKGKCIVLPFEDAAAPLRARANSQVVDGLCTFTAIMTDRRQAEGGDSFTISTNGGPFLGGALTSGDIEIST